MNRYSDNTGCLPAIVTIIALIIGLFIVFGMNSATDDIWNEGICPECNIEYTLRGTSRNNLNYYICKQCGQKVVRYFNWWME